MRKFLILVAISLPLAGGFSLASPSGEKSQVNNLPNSLTPESRDVLGVDTKTMQETAVPHPAQLDVRLADSRGSDGAQADGRSGGTNRPQHEKQSHQANLDLLFAPPPGGQAEAEEPGIDPEAEQPQPNKHGAQMDSLFAPAPGQPPAEPQPQGDRHGAQLDSKDAAPPGGQAQPEPPQPQKVEHPVQLDALFAPAPGQPPAGPSPNQPQPSDLVTPSDSQPVVPPQPNQPQPSDLVTPSDSQPDSAGQRRGPLWGNMDGNTRMKRIEFPDGRVWIIPQVGD